jgi:hypothetical protein
VNCYLAAHEAEQLQDKARLAGLPLSVFLREAALGKRIHTLPVINAQRWGELAPLQANLNQLVRHLNNGTTHEVDEVLLAGLLAEVKDLRQALIGGGGE